MANNRMYIKCNGCRKAISLSRHYGGPWSIDRDRDEVDSFLRRHYPCCGFDGSHGGDFSLVYESDHPWDFEVEYSGEPPDEIRQEIEDYYKRMEKIREPPEEPPKIPKTKIMFFVNSHGDEFRIMADVQSKLKNLGGDVQLMPFDVLMSGSKVSFICYTPSEEIFDNCLEHIRQIPDVGGIMDGEGNTYKAIQN